MNTLEMIGFRRQPAEPNDRVWLEQYAATGDMDAFAALAERYRAMVLATCWRVLGNQTDAEDATQETFLQLAQRAGTIRSNVAAWLHAAARGAAIDLVRRRAVRVNADAMAATTASTTAVTQPADLTTAVWSEVEPILDEALAALPEADRGLLVARYLAGRSQRSLAREAGVADGTMSRRIERALERLRAELAQRGLREHPSHQHALGGALLMGSGGVACSETCRAGIAKAGLSQIASGQGPSQAVNAGLGSGLLISSAAVLLLAGGVATVLRTNPKASGTAIVPLVQPEEQALGPDRVSGELGPFEVVTVTDDSFVERAVWFGDGRMSVAHGRTAEGELKRAVLRIVSTEVQGDELDMRDEGVVIEARLDQLTPIDDPYSRFTGMGRMQIRATFDELNRLVLEPLTDGLQLGRNEPRWFGVRPPMGFAEQSRIPEDAGEFGLLGPWGESERIPVTISAREIHFGTDSWTAATYRVIEWERVPGYARVLSVHAGGRDPTLIGTRFRLLLRAEPESAGGGYTIAYYPPGAGMGNAWPSGFEVTAENPVRVVTFRGDG